MQNEVHVYRSASHAVFDPCDVPVSSSSPQRVLRLAQKPSLQKSHRGQTSDRPDQRCQGRQWQGLWLSIGRQGIAQQCPERRKLHDDLVELGETSCPNSVARLARLAGTHAQIGYKRKPGKYSGKPSVVVDNTLDRQFDVAAPDTAWVSPSRQICKANRLSHSVATHACMRENGAMDITYIKTYEGFLYLAAVIDLYSRRVIALSWFVLNHCQVTAGPRNHGNQPTLSCKRC